jgi:hypothetical protein
MCWNNRGVNRDRSRSRRVMMVVVTSWWFSRYRSNRSVNRRLNRGRSRWVVVVVVTGWWFSRYRGRMVRRV